MFDFLIEAAKFLILVLVIIFVLIGFVITFMGFGDRGD